MFERLDTPEELFSFKLGSALKMENELLDALEDLEQSAHREEIKSALREHRAQTRQHVANVEQCFRLLGEEVDDSPCPTIEAMTKEAKATLKKADDSLADIVVLSAAGEAEHHEIAVYEALIANAQARGEIEVVALLRRNLEQEEHALAIARSSLQQVAREGAPAGVSA
jgi:ferritin-like metal-binding protein YciE